MSLSVIGVVFADWMTHVEWLARLLDDNERAASEMRTHVKDTRDHVISHGVLRLVIGRALDSSPSGISFVRLDCAYCGAPHGAPRLHDGAMRFSLSRADDRALIALSDTDVGVDIERYRREALLDATLRQVSAPGEAYPCDRDPIAQLGWWVRKEALVKATGEGLLAAGRYDVATGAPAGWWITPLTTASPHVAALAVRKEAESTVPPIEWLRPQDAGRHIRAAPAGWAL